MGRIGVLLVDDDEGYAATLATFLGLHDDIEVLAVSPEGRQAVEEYGRLRPDVVVMDVYMPGMDGVEATRQLVRADPDARVVMLSAHDTPELRERSRAAGALAFVPKQHATRGLVAAIREAASQRVGSGTEAPEHDAVKAEPGSESEQMPGPASREPEGTRATEPTESLEPAAFGSCKTTQARAGDIVVTVSFSVAGGGWLFGGD